MKERKEQKTMLKQTRISNQKCQNEQKYYTHTHTENTIQMRARMRESRDHKKMWKEKKVMWSIFQ